MPEMLGKVEAEQLISTILKKAKKPLTTREIEEIVQGKGKQCPDSAVRFLNKMRYKGLINGKMSLEHRGWIWWLDKEEIRG